MVGVIEISNVPLDDWGESTESANEREAARNGADPSDLGWDRVTMRKYPSASAVVEMGASDEYRAALPNRAEAIEDSVVYAFGGNQMRNVPLSESPDTIYHPLVRLIRHRKTLRPWNVTA